MPEIGKNFHQILLNDVLTAIDKAANSVESELIYNNDKVYIKKVFDTYMDEMKKAVSICINQKETAFLKFLDEVKTSV
ncbi:MAG: hypothetical protein LKJ25_00865 [Clostridia bacterium]|jgi:hypothetical protein|nr:hypothetical protein [Clostridia bacterium]